MFPLLLGMALALGLMYTLFPESKIFFDPRYRDVSGWDSIGVPPTRGNCKYIGRFWPENPFRGWPVKKFECNWNTISAWFCDPDYFVGYTHWGIDIARIDWTTEGSIDGAEVVATAKAKVIWAVETTPPQWNYGMGNYVRIEALVPVQVCECEENESSDEFRECFYGDQNGDGVVGGYCWYEDRPSGWTATYMHLKKVLVKQGDIVEPGTVLGLIDNTGASTGPHLHYQINAPKDGREPDGAIDPAPHMCDTYSDALREQRKGTR
ncbi:MAG: M23 family metallopeptidase [Chloroflexi bacterium]|nr:M23 family metallopeptidase [Chloroflexota bacterium]